MKGKYANAAERRRYLAELEERAVVAGQAQRKAETELARHREKTDEKIRRLTQRLQDAIGQRDAHAAPRITELEQQVEVMRLRAVQAEEEQKGITEKWHMAVHGMRDYLVSTQGLTNVEALEVIVTSMRGKSLITMLNTDGRSVAADSGETIARELVLGRAQGNRSAGAVPAVVAEAIAQGRHGGDR